MNNLLNRIKKVSVQVLEAKQPLTVDNIVLQSLFSSGGTLSGFETEIENHLNKSQIEGTVVLSKYGNNTIEYDGTEVRITDSYCVDNGYFDKKNNLIRYDNAFRFNRNTYDKALKSANYYNIKSFY